MDNESSRAKSLVPLQLDVCWVYWLKRQKHSDHYPLTLNGIVTASNQKSNRDPKMEIDEQDALIAIDELKEQQAVREVQGSGRAIKYRHAAYEWMDIGDAGSAVMTGIAVERTSNSWRTSNASLADVFLCRPSCVTACARSIV